MSRAELLERLETHRRNLADLRQQQAELGALAPPAIQRQIEAEETAVQALEQKLARGVERPASPAEELPRQHTEEIIRQMEPFDRRMDRLEKKIDELTQRIYELEMRIARLEYRLNDSGLASGRRTLWMVLGLLAGLGLLMVMIAARIYGISG